MSDLTLYISANLDSSFSAAWDSFLDIFQFVIDSLAHISLGGVSLLYLWIGFNLMLTVITLALTVPQNGAGNAVGTRLRERPRSSSFSMTRGFVNDRGEVTKETRVVGRGSSRSFRSK